MGMERGGKESRFCESRMEETREDFLPPVSQSLLSLAEACPSQATSRRTPEVSSSHRTSQKLPPCPSLQSQRRRNTLPSVTVIPPLPLLVNQSHSHLQVPTHLSPSKSRSMAFLPHPPPPSSRASSVRPALLPPLRLASSITSLVSPAPCSADGSRASLRRHSVQLGQVRGGGGERSVRLDQ